MAEIVTMRNLVSGVATQAYDHEASAIVAHPWFSKYIVIEPNPLWPPEVVTEDMTTSLSDWTVDEDGYMTNG